MPSHYPKSSVFTAIGFLMIITLVLITMLRHKIGSFADKPQLLKVQVFYESFCQDSVRFIREHLYPAMVTKNLLQYTDLHFVPYGNAWTYTWENNTILYCPHGNDECKLNALHACIVKHHRIEEQLSLITCSLNEISTFIDVCAFDLNIDVSATKSCEQSHASLEMLRVFGAKTMAMNITILPATIIDGVYDRLRQNEINQKFESAFCQRYKEKYGIILNACVFLN